MTRPEYVTRETLAKLLDMKKPGYIDRLVKIGALPQPQLIGDALRWRWETVDKMLSGVADARTANTNNVEDPFNAGAANAKTSTARFPGAQPRRQIVHLPPARAGRTMPG